MTALLITGARGQLGTDLVTLAASENISAEGLGFADLDITNALDVETAVAAFAAKHRADGVIINAAAYTAVDKAEADSDAAYAVNAAGPENLARSAAAHGLGLIHVSTDYVFPGDGTTPYEVDSATGPTSVYGASKLLGEQAVLREHPRAHVVRTAWVFGVTGPNFVKTMCMLEGKHPTVSVVSDQTGSPTWSRDLAAGLIELAQRSDVPGGVLHATNAGATTWCGLTRAIFELIGADPSRVLETTTGAFPRPAPRPAYSVMSSKAWEGAGLTPLRAWQEALSSALRDHREAFLPEG
ncbi:dTDP-4-dehydrorhamnose reductase [Nakamurella antarctica]|uniref:dTDP-4-dehydrorhamnose reductase n=1 Tax=Nakamurella antarctica TaxID=1902245 RepID=A0A3G8ZMQ9_9ACTN|nr:dTDP-4-dehydrorhamnose reductase [Nakamurella antarctica]AZI58533.1 dTDP-4-dehydrorhamnose reductase [Nakamurella antarctica]